MGPTNDEASLFPWFQGLIQPLRLGHSGCAAGAGRGAQEEELEGKEPGDWGFFSGPGQERRGDDPQPHTATAGERRLGASPGVYWLWALRGVVDPPGPHGFLIRTKGTVKHPRRVSEKGVRRGTGDKGHSARPKTVPDQLSSSIALVFVTWPRLLGRDKAPTTGRPGGRALGLNSGPGQIPGLLG